MKNYIKKLMILSLRLFSLNSYFILYTRTSSLSYKAVCLCFYPSISVDFSKHANSTRTHVLKRSLQLIQTEDE